MKDLDTLIAELQAFRAQHGNITVYHHDCEWGLSDAAPGLCKVLAYKEGDIVQNFSDEHIAQARHAIAEHSITMFEEAWDHLEEEFRTGWESREAYLQMMEDAHNDRVKFVERCNQTPFSVVF